jgi:selenide,water dikinase
LRIAAHAVPVLAGVHERISKGVFAGGLTKNEAFLASELEVDPSLDLSVVRALHDPQTSGGLLVVLPREKGEAFVAAARAAGMPHAALIGEIEPKGRAAVAVAAR